MKNKFLIIFFFLFLSTTSYADNYTNTKYHFSFIIPQGWTEISQEMVDEAIHQLEDVAFIGGFASNELGSSGNSMLIMRYFTYNGTWNNLIRLLLTDSEVNNPDYISIPDGTDYISIINILNSNPQLVIDSRRMFVGYDESRNNTILVVFIHIGRYGFVHIGLIFPKDNYNSYIPDIINVIDSLRFDDEYIYNNDIEIE